MYAAKSAGVTTSCDNCNDITNNLPIARSRGQPFSQDMESSEHTELSKSIMRKIPNPLSSVTRRLDKSLMQIIF
jgi:hypothetical protein